MYRPETTAFFRGVLRGLVFPNEMTDDAVDWIAGHAWSLHQLGYLSQDTVLEQYMHGPGDKERIRGGYDADEDAATAHHAKAQTRAQAATLAIGLTNSRRSVLLAIEASGLPGDVSQEDWRWLRITGAVLQAPWAVRQTYVVHPSLKEFLREVAP